MSDRILTSRDIRVLLEESLSRATDAETSRVTEETLFTPPQHKNALDPDVTIVKGGRGVGKTVWFEALQDEQQRSVARDRYSLPILDGLKVRAGFGARLSKEYPTARRLAWMIESGIEPVDVWTAVALYAFGDADVSAIEDWPARVQWVCDNSAEVDERFLELDDKAAAEDATYLLLFDALDRLHSQRRYADMLAGGVLRLALHLRQSTSRLRAKVFIRYDMLESSHKEFADASKLTTNAVDLLWTDTSLYSLLFHLVSRNDSEVGRLFSSEIGWSPGRVGNVDELKDALHLIAPVYMGSNHRKGYTYKWIPNHLADGRSQVSPRSFLSALTHANEKTSEKFSDYEKALHFDAIREGVQHASQIRVDEVGEDTPWVSDALRPLDGTQVPIERDVVYAAWDEAGLKSILREDAYAPELTGDGGGGVGEFSDPMGPLSTDYDTLVDELMRLGILTMREDGRLDLPDVYRIAFRIGRKGGVPVKRA